MNELIEKVEGWACVRNLHAADPKEQVLKVIEGFAVMVEAHGQGEKAEVVDGIGDTFVAVIILSKQLGADIEGISEAADRIYNTTKNTPYIDFVAGFEHAVGVIGNLSSSISKDEEVGTLASLARILLAVRVIAEEENTSPATCLFAAYMKNQRGDTNE